jgi:ATP-dependent helicase HrpA
MSHDVAASLDARIALCRSKDQPALQRQLQAVRAAQQRGGTGETLAADLAGRIETSLSACAGRRQRLPVLQYPPELPISGAREALVAAIAAHPVVVICGATGSGKTTQIPKLCLEAGRGVRGLIGHTQPRRLAARTVASRLAQELGSPLGEVAGYQVRFAEQLGPDPFIKVMTDGILLAELTRDRMLWAYDTLIIDEAHERSLNIDFLLGYLKRLLPRRPDLKLIITSATIDPERFARHFDGAPIFSVAGRTYPVEIRYRPLDEDPRSGRDMVDGVLRAVTELDRAGREDLLVFVSGERDIRELGEALRRQDLPGTEILPLYARLAARHQDLVFRPHRLRRIVLATNVAETSLTVPGIRHVIDTGLARISRYSHRTKVGRLPIEPISQASADQRAGRCGRTAPGICIRLYSEADYLARPRFTDPEILRTNLASVVLQMKALRLGEIDAFPFPDPPDARYVNDALQLLRELGALDAAGRLTRRGHDLARLPVDPMLGRMVLAGAELHCLHEVLIIASALAVGDPRERPPEKAALADARQAVFRHPRSDFLSYLGLWDAWRAAGTSGSARRAFCEHHLVSALRMREWADVHRELLQLIHEQGLRVNQEPAPEAMIHQALLSGLLGRIGRKREEGDYQGPRGVRFHLHPGSGLARKRPEWVMAAELVQTTRLYARTVAAIEPQWVEAVAGELIKRSYLEPHWQPRAGRVGAFLQTSLHGLVLSARRLVNYGPIDPALSRTLFIRDGLAAGECRTRGGFLAHNRALEASVREDEAKLRQPGALLDEEASFAFYDRRLPGDIHDMATFERWREAAERENPRLLFMSREDLVRPDSAWADGRAYPDHMTVAGIPLRLRYCFEPGDPEDGVTVQIPAPALGPLRPEDFERLVPGMLAGKVEALIRALPKSLRRHFIPAPHFAQAATEVLLEQPDVPLRVGLSQALARMTGVQVPVADWPEADLPDALRMRFEVLAPDGAVLAAGRDLGDLQAALRGDGRIAAPTVKPAPAPAGATPWDRERVTEWDFGALPAGPVAVVREGIRVPAWPALAAEAAGVALRLFDRPEAALASHRSGVAALARLRLGPALRYLEKNMPLARDLGLLYAPLGRWDALRADLVEAVLTRLFLAEPLPHDRASFESRLEEGRGRLMEVAEQAARAVHGALMEWKALWPLLQTAASEPRRAALADLRAQVEWLMQPGFVARTPDPWLSRIAVYLKGARLRLEKLSGRLARDAQWQASVSHWMKRWADLPPTTDPERLARRETLRWLIEEYRLSLFAQELGTVTRVSERRLEEMLSVCR